MVNNEIKAEKVRLVTNESKETQVISRDEAQRMADEQELDLICVNPKGDIPVVIIDDYNHFLYKQKQKDKENKKKARANLHELKTIKITDSISQHDLQIKAKNIDRILGDGDDVLMSIQYKGRTIKQIEYGPEMLNRLYSLVKHNNKIEQHPKIRGNTVTMRISSVR